MNNAAFNKNPMNPRTPVITRLDSVAWSNTHVIMTKKVKLIKAIATMYVIQFASTENP